MAETTESPLVSASPASPLTVPPVVATPPVVIALPVPPPPQETIQIDVRWLRKVGILTMCALFVAVLAVVAYHVVPHISFAKEEVIEAEVFAMRTQLPTQVCRKLTEAEILSGTSLSGSLDLRDVKTSLLHHLRKAEKAGTPMGGISAQVLQSNRVCYSIIDMATNVTAPPDYKVMINLEIIAVSPNAIVSSDETSPLCRSMVTRARWSEIAVQYYNERGVYMQREVYGDPALIIQQQCDLQQAVANCEEDSNIEASVANMQRDVRELKNNVAHLQTNLYYAQPTDIARLAPGHVQMLPAAATPRSSARRLPPGGE